MVSSKGCHPPAHSSLRPASGTAISLSTLTCTYAHFYSYLHPNATFSELLPDHTAKSHSSLLSLCFLCRCLLVLIFVKSISISISILYLTIIIYMKFICFLIDCKFDEERDFVCALIIHLPVQGRVTAQSEDCVPEFPKHLLYVSSS